VASIAGCILTDDNNTLNMCNPPFCGCLACNDTQGVYSNGSCVSCLATISNCISCFSNMTNSPICNACDPAYTLNNSSNQCVFCNKSCSSMAITGCTIIDVNNTLDTCNPPFCGCLACNGSQGVYSNNGCSLCSGIISNCISCFSNTTLVPICTACDTMYVLNNSTN
jgi:hypothetical protein